MFASIAPEAAARNDWSASHSQLCRSTHSSSECGPEYWGRPNRCQRRNSKIDEIDATFRKRATESAMSTRDTHAQR